MGVIFLRVIVPGVQSWRGVELQRRGLLWRLRLTGLESRSFRVAEVLSYVKGF